MKAAITGISLVVILSAWCTVGHASEILWDEPSGITGDTDVQTGNVLLALNYNTATGNQTVNGVAFTGTADRSATINGFTVEWTPNHGSKQFAVIAASADEGPFAGLSESYRAILGNNALTSGPADNNALIKISGGFKSGRSYRIILFVNFSKEPVTRSNRYTDVTVEGGMPSPGVSVNTSEEVGGLGQYLVGNFTGEAVHESDGLGLQCKSVGAGYCQLSAIEILDTTDNP